MPSQLDTILAASLSDLTSSVFGIPDSLIEGTAGDDLLFGTGVGDVIVGFAGDDVLLGLSGDDTLIGGPGSDLLNGGAGFDIVDFDADDFSFGPVDLTITAGQIIDDITGDVDTIVDIEEIFLVGFFNDINIDASTTDVDLFLGSSNGNSNILGGSGDDAIIVDVAGENTVDGGDGFDILTLVGLPFDTIDSDALVTLTVTGTSASLSNSDAVTNFTSFESISVSAGLGVDIVDASATEIDLLFSPGFSVSDTTFIGGFGDDLIAITAPGADFDGGAGFDAVDLRPNVLAAIDGGPEATSAITLTDSAFLTNTEEAVSNFTSVEAFAITDFEDDLDVDASTVTLAITAELGGGADTIVSGSGSDTLNGQAGEDTLEGGAGADLLLGGLGADLLSGGDGADALFGGFGDDVLSGGAGADTIGGGGGDDLITGTLAEVDGDTILNFDLGDVLFVTGEGITGAVFDADTGTLTISSADEDSTLAVDLAAGASADFAVALVDGGVEIALAEAFV
ncbi:MAG: hypothetical protein ACFB2Z_06925 [Maricaulaceae bacterium]